MAEIKNLDELIKNVGTTTTNNLLIEYILLLRGKSDVLDKIEEALENKSTTIEDIKTIIENAGNDDLDFME